MKPARTLLLAVLLAAAGILPSLPARAAEDKVDLQGEWTTDCLKIGKNDRHGIITRITIRDSRIHAVSQIYASNGCQRPTVQVRYEGTLDGGLKDQDSLLFAHTVTSITMPPNEGDVVERYNRDPKGMGCGLSDWKENIALDVDGRTCAAITFARKGKPCSTAPGSMATSFVLPPSRSNGRTTRRTTGHNPRLKPSITEHPIRSSASSAGVCGNRATALPILHATLPIAHFLRRFFHTNVAYHLNRSFARRERRLPFSRSELT